MGSDARGDTSAGDRGAQHAHQRHHQSDRGAGASSFAALRRAGADLASVSTEALATPLTGVSAIDEPRRHELANEMGTDLWQCKICGETTCVPLTDSQLP
jgi:hypothetical protein